MKALQQVVEAWRDLTFPWGPTGSVGFELASGHHVTTEVSDLDIAIRAHERISVEQARSLWERVIGLQTKVDIRVETPECGFSLEEYVNVSSRRILLRYSANLARTPGATGRLQRRAPHERRLHLSWAGFAVSRDAPPLARSPPQSSARSTR